MCATKVHIFALQHTHPSISHFHVSHYCKQTQNVIFSQNTLTELKELKIACVFRNGKAQWEPNIDKYKCLGFGACQTNDVTADTLRKTSGADVRTCTTLQDGDKCKDYDCNKHKSLIRNPIMDSIPCKFSQWDKPDNPYCIFCPGGRHKISITNCADCSKGKFLRSGPDHDVVMCDDCRAGEYQFNEGKSECFLCATGQYQNRTGQAECHNCPVGKYQGAAGQPSCNDCGAGQHQSSEGQRDCNICPVGQYQNATGQPKCRACSIGQHQGNAGQLNCEPCGEGQYQSSEGQHECNVCPAGQYQKVMGQAECHNCPAGQYQDDKGQLKCDECPEGDYNREPGQSTCRECEFYYICLTQGLQNPPFNFLVAIVPIFILALIFPIVKLVQLVVRATRAWKPQSKEDAALAKKFIVPKKSAEMAQNISTLKVYEEKFLSQGWTDEDIVAIKSQCEHVVQYLGERVEHAHSREQVRIQQCCLKMDVMYDFKTLYGATMGNIKKKEPEGFKRFTDMAREMQVAAFGDCPPNPSELIDLYRSGRAVYDRFHAFIGEAVQASGSAHVYKTHDNTRQPGMKGIYRVVEKGVFKYKDDLTGDLHLGQVRDLVRGGIIDLTMLGLASIGEYILTSDKVTVCRVKDRFNNPSAAGWTDLMVNLFFNDDPGKHVCEVQLIHFKMLSQRTTQEGHGAYNVFRVRTMCCVTSPTRLC